MGRSWGNANWFKASSPHLVFIVRRSRIHYQLSGKKKEKRKNRIQLQSVCEDLLDPSPSSPYPITGWNVKGHRLSCNYGFKCVSTHVYMPIAVVWHYNLLWACVFGCTTGIVSGVFRAIKIGWKCSKSQFAWHAELFFWICFFEPARCSIFPLYWNTSLGL